MAEVDNTEVAAPAKKRRKAQGPRQTKPIYLVVKYTDENGNQVKLNKANLSIEPTKDPSQVIDLVTEGSEVATVVTIRVETERPSPAAA